MRRISAAALLATALTSSGDLRAAAIDLAPSSFHHITFPKIPPTTYGGDARSLVATVARSSSLLLQPFAATRVVRAAHITWRSAGDLRQTSVATEQTKDGDDARLKIGLLLAGPAPFIPFFAPAWAKAIRDHMTLSTDHALVLVAGALAPVGTRWPSPHADDITMLSIASGPAAAGGSWRRSDVAFPEPLAVVGLWIMADGDDTQSSFTTEVKELFLDEQAADPGR
jgi:hypothetical protein